MTRIFSHLVANSSFCTSEIKLFFAGILAYVRMFVEAESHPKYPKNNEESNIRDGEIWVNLNECENDNPCELQQGVKYCFQTNTLKGVNFNVKNWGT